MPEGLLLVVSGPSGAGKGTICRELFKRMPGLVYSVSSTTRRPRPSEKQGVDYNFVSEEEFNRLIATDSLVEWACFSGNYYGTPQEPVMRELQAGHDVLLEIDVQGAIQVKKKFPAAVTVFIMPPSYQELRRRLINRGTDDADEVNRRLSVAMSEINRAKEYDYLVVNQEVPLAMAKIEAIMVAEKCRPSFAAKGLFQEGN